MKFEDLVDMDWLNSNTTTGDSLPQSPALVVKGEPEGFPSMADYYPDDLYGQEPDLLWQHDIQPMTIDSPSSPASSSASSHTENAPAPSAVPDLIDPKNTSPASAGFVMPTTDQIKLLIEEAKRQLALREEHQRMQQQQQQQQQQQPQLDADASHHLKQEPHEPEQAPVSEKNVSPTAFENTCDPMTLFGAAAAAAAAAVPDTISPESLMKGKQRRHSPSPSPSPARRESSVSASTVNDEAMTLEAYAESDGIDIKKLTPKERRQLRNKISARNFRVRRKEYITTLEAQVDDHKRRADRLQLRLDNVEEENKQLRMEVDSLKRENQLLQQQQQQQQQKQSSSVSSAASSSSSSELTRPQSPRVSSPLPKPNLNKDISMLGSKASDTYRQDSRILVSNAVMPAWNFDRIFAEKTSPPSLPEPPVLQCAAYILTCFVQLTQTTPSSKTVHDAAVPFEEKNNTAWTAPLLPDERDFSAGDDKQPLEQQQWQQPSVASPAYMEYLYDTLIMSALMTNAQTGSYVTDKSFWWWDTPTL